MPIRHSHSGLQSRKAEAAVRKSLGSLLWSMGHRSSAVTPVTLLLSLSGANKDKSNWKQHQGSFYTLHSQFFCG